MYLIIRKNVVDVYHNMIEEFMQEKMHVVILLVQILLASFDYLMTFF
jgi:hypothetical protein